MIFFFLKEKKKKISHHIHKLSNRERKKSKKKKKKQAKKNEVQCSGAFLVAYFHELPPLRKHFGGLGEKTLNPHHFFSSPLFNQTLSKNIFTLLFSSQFFILPKISLNKRTLRVHGVFHLNHS